ncbi:hypothetical protein C8F01DRAFT_1257888 [Mycena amicta]|nr:hypothetical protein C8F01DRAFT_1257888 [Mycena amicta]
MTRRQTGPRKKPDKPPQQNKDTNDRPSGWIWNLGKLSKMSDTEMDEWSREGDRVQWFRAEAEMKRWQGQKEQKIAELLRTRRSFQKMDTTWTQLAAQNDLAGYQAYARQKAAMYRAKGEEARILIFHAGYGELLEESGSLLQRIQEDRRKAEALLTELQFLLRPPVQAAGSSLVYGGLAKW